MSAITSIQEMPDLTVNYGKAEIIAALPKDEKAMKRYRKDARLVLDLLASNDGKFAVNPIGLSILLFCVAQEMENGYHGKDNNHD